MKVPVTALSGGMVLVNGQTVARVATLETPDPGPGVFRVTTRDESGVLHMALEHGDTEYEVEAIDITPTWSAILPVLLGVLQNDEAPVSAQKEAMANLTGMAALADKFVDLVKRGSGDTVGLTPVLGDPDQKES